METDDISAAVHCCHNMCYFFHLRDEEQHNEYFARKLIELGRRCHDTEAIAEGYRSLIMNYRRSGDWRLLERLRAEINALLGGTGPLDDAVIAELLSAADDRSNLPSNADELRPFLKNRQDD
jgi:hypothetical protein